MDKDEAERLTRAIRMVKMDWIQVSGVEYNSRTDKYEVKCVYKQVQKGLFHSKEDICQASFSQLVPVPIEETI